MGVNLTYESGGVTYCGQIMEIESTSILRYGDGLAINVSFFISGTDQGTGGYFANGDTLVRWITGVTRVAGVEEWEQLKGERVIVLRERHAGQIIGIASIEDDGRNFFFKEPGK